MQSNTGPGAAHVGHRLGGRQRRGSRRPPSPPSPGTPPAAAVPYRPCRRRARPRRHRPRHPHRYWHRSLFRDACCHRQAGGDHRRTRALRHPPLSQGAPSTCGASTKKKVAGVNPQARTRARANRTRAVNHNFQEKQEREQDAVAAAPAIKTCQSRQRRYPALNKADAAPLRLRHGRAPVVGQPPDRSQDHLAPRPAGPPAQRRHAAAALPTAASWRR